MALSFNINILTMYIFYWETEKRLRVSDRQGNYAFTQESFYLQGIFNYINERYMYTFCFDCKHKQMLQKTKLHLTDWLSCIPFVTYRILQF